MYFRLASHESDDVAASGITSISAWYTSTNRASQTREKWKVALVRLIQILSSSHDTDSSPQQGSSVSPTRKKLRLDSDVLAGLIMALPIELSYWRWDLSREERVEVLGPLIRLLDSGLLEGPVRLGISTTLAVLAMLVNDHQEFPNNEIQLEELGDIAAEWEDKYQSQHEKPNQNRVIGNEQKRAQRSRRAQWTAYIFASKPEYLRQHSDALLVFGLAGLLDSFTELGLANSENATRISSIVAAQLQKMPVINQSRPITLPGILPATCDVRVYLMDAVTRALDPSPREGGLDPRPAAAKKILLQCLSEKQHVWLDFGSQLLMPVVQLLHSDGNLELQGQCLAALDEYCLTNSTSGYEDEVNVDSHYYHNPVDWQFFFSLAVPHRLIKIASETAGLRSRAISSFDSLCLILPSGNQDPDPGEVHRHISHTVKSLVLDGLLDTLADIVCRDGYKHLEVWRNQIINLPESLASAADARSVELIRHFCTDRVKRSEGRLTRMILRLKDKLDLKHPERM